MDNKRKLAVDLLIRAESEESYINIALSGTLDRAAPSDRAFINRLVNGVVERRITLDYYIATMAKRSVSEIDAPVLAILRTALFQLACMEGEPDYAVVNESVALCKNRGERGFVNALLRRFLRERDTLSLPLREKNAVRHISVKYSFPPELCRFFIDNFGEERCERFFEYFNGISPLTLRVNTLKTTASQLMSNIDGAEVSALCDTALIIPGGAVVRELYGYNEGLFYVQDVSSQIAVKALGATEGARVIDVCAAPGGKSIGLAIEMKNRGEVFSFDLHKSKLSLIESNAKRLGIDIISVAERDATILPDGDMTESFDFVMCDVPCSGLGVLGKKADMRYRHTDSVKTLPPLQYSILSASCRYLKRGGATVYSTCTVNPDENERVVERFLSENPDFELSPFETDGEICKGMYTFLPGEKGTDGFFIARIVRK